jgi:hypothetical protein
MATTKTTTAKKATAKKAVAPKRDTVLCHWHAGSYGSPKTADCKVPHLVNRQLCAEHEAAWKVIAKKRATAKKASTPEAPKLTVVKPARRPAPRHAGAVSRVPESMAAFLTVEPTVTKVE